MARGIRMVETLPFQVALLAIAILFALYFSVNAKAWQIKFRFAIFVVLIAILTMSHFTCPSGFAHMLAVFFAMVDVSDFVFSIRQPVETLVEVTDILQAHAQVVVAVHLILGYMLGSQSQERIHPRLMWFFFAFDGLVRLSLVFGCSLRTGDHNRCITTRLGLRTLPLWATFLACQFKLGRSDQQS